MVLTLDGNSITLYFKIFTYISFEPSQQITLAILISNVSDESSALARLLHHGVHEFLKPSLHLQCEFGWMQQWKLRCILTYKDKIEAWFYYIIVLQRFPMKMISIVFWFHLFPASNAWLAGLAPGVEVASSAASRSFRRSKPLKASADKAGLSASWQEVALRVSPSIVSCHIRFLKEFNPTSGIIRSTKINWKTTMGLKLFLASSGFLMYLLLLTLAFFTDINIELFNVIVLVAPSSVKWKVFWKISMMCFLSCIIHACGGRTWGAFLSWPRRLSLLRWSVA